MVNKFTDADEIAFLLFMKTGGKMMELLGCSINSPVRMLFIRQALIILERDTELRKLLQVAVLDVGCGGGLLTEPLKRLGADVTGLDASADAIESRQRSCFSCGAGYRLQAW